MAHNVFIKIPGITPKIAVDGHPDEISITGFEYALSQQGGQGYGKGGGVGKSNFEDIKVFKKADSASPVLLQFCATGKHLDEVTISFGDGAESLKITLNSCIISLVKMDAAGDVELPSETIAINFAEIKVSYGGGSPMGYKIKEQTVT